MDLFKKVILVLSVIIAIQSFSLAELNPPTIEANKIDLSLGFPSINAKLWLDKNQAAEIAVSPWLGGYYLKYLRKFYLDYYYGIGCIGINNNWGHGFGILFGEFGSDFPIFSDWLFMDLGVFYFPFVPAEFSLYPNIQIGARFNI